MAINQKFTAYSKATGEVLYDGVGDNPEIMETAEIGILLGERHGQGWLSGNTYNPLPSPPSSHHRFNYTTKQWADPRTPDTEWPLVRAKRNILLQQSDWTQLPDVPLETKETWAVYRQALRDVTDQSDPFNIVWPAAPG
jgi:hypothetical protein